MKKFLSATSLFITILVLLAIMIGLQQFDYESSGSVFNPKSLAATGFIILAAFTMGEFFRAIKIPALLGYIAAGILFGPNLAPMISPRLPTLFSMSVIDDLALINVLTVGVIGTMGGGELRIQDIKGNIKTIFLVIVLIGLLVVPSTAGAVILMAKYTPSLVPFIAGTSQESVIAAALLLGVFAMAMSPAATLAILQETKAKGKFTSLTLGIVVVADIALVLTFLLTFSFDKILLAPGGFQMHALMDALPHIAAEFGYALLIGVVTGAIYILYMRFVARELMFFTVAVIFAASYASNLLHAETLMAFLTAGFIVQNFSKHGHDMIHSLEKISLPVFVIYFMTQAAQLDLQAVYGFLGVTAVLTIIRGAAFYSGTKIATKWSGAKENVKQYLWLCFFSRGGVDLVLGAMVAKALTPWGQDFQTVIMAVVVVHIVAGPPLLKLGLDWAGETESSKLAEAAAAASVTQGATTATVSQEDLSFPIPQLGDRHLQPRMEELREFLTNLHTTHIAQKFESKASKIRKFIGRLETSTNHSLSAVTEVLERNDIDQTPTGNAERAKEVRKIRTRYHQSISGLVKDLYATKTTVIDEFAVSDILRQIRQEEAFSSSYRVPNYTYYFETNESDPTWVRLLKSFRRLARLITGSSGIRRIPFGRLWRFYVELDVPHALNVAATKSSERNQKLWSLLGQHIRHVDQVFLDITRILNEEVDIQSLEIIEENEEESHDHEPDETDGEVDELAPPPPNVALEALKKHQEIVAKRRSETLAALDDWEATSIRLYTLSLKGPYCNLLCATYKSGTLELPAFMYRPSLRFDASRNSEKNLHETIRIEENYTEGQKGWIITDEQNLNFTFWFDVFSTRLSSKLNTSLNTPVQSKLDDLERFCKVLPSSIRDYNHQYTVYEEALAEAVAEREAADRLKLKSNAPSSTSLTEPTPEPDLPQPPPVPVVDWEDWYLNQIKPQIDRARNTLEFLRQTFNDSSPMSRHGRTLEVRIERFALHLLLLQGNPDEADNHSDVIRFSPQEWFVQELETAVKLRLSEVNERVRSILQLSLNAIDDFEQFTALNLVTPLSADSLEEGVENDAQRINTNAINVTQHAAKMAGELSASQAKRVAELRRWLQAQLHDIIQTVSTPIEKRDTRRLSRTSSKSSKREKNRSPLFFFRHLNIDDQESGPFSIPLFSRVRSNLFQLMHDQQQIVTLNDVRNYLRPASSSYIRGGSTVPDIYRRLFTPGPLNINGFYIARHVSHNDLLTAIDAWRYTPMKSTILVHADRGFGKASLIRHVLSVPSLEKVRKISVRLREDLTSIDDLVRDVLSSIQEDPQSTLETTAVRALDTQDSISTDTPSSLSSYHDLESAIRAIKRASETPMIVVLENAHKLHSRTEEGLQLCTQFLKLMNETKNQVLWISLCNSTAVQWLETAIEFKSYFTHTIELEPFAPTEIKRLIQRRHPISGFTHKMMAQHTSFYDWIFHPFKTYHENEHPEDRFFDSIARLSKGSPLLGLTYWLDCVELDPHDDSHILVHDPRKHEIDLTTPLSLNKQIILAALIQHGSITATGLAQVLRQPIKKLETELHHLMTLGFIEIVAGAKFECYRLRAYAEALVTPQLRRRNIL